MQPGPGLTVCAGASARFPRDVELELERYRVKQHVE